MPKKSIDSIWACSLRCVTTEATINISDAHAFLVSLSVLVEAADLLWLGRFVVDGAVKRSYSQYWYRIRCSYWDPDLYDFRYSRMTWDQQNIHQHLGSQRLGICAKSFMIQMFPAGNHFNTRGFFWTTGHCKIPSALTACHRDGVFAVVSLIL